MEQLRGNRLCDVGPTHAAGSLYELEYHGILAVVAAARRQSHLYGIECLLPTDVDGALVLQLGLLPPYSAGSLAVRGGIH